MRFDKLAIGLILSLFALAGPAAQAQQGPTQPVCANCHEAQWNAIDLTRARREERRQRQHVPGVPRRRAEHLKDPTKAKPANPFGQGGHGGRAGGGLPHLPHAATATSRSGHPASTRCNDVTCSQLPQHPRQGAHPPAVNKFVTTFLPNQADVCGTCHQPIRAANFKPSHHPIIEGKVKCSDCHNPHGALSPAMVKQPTINDQCYSCHADKRGPYVFNHPPVEENCATCHNPHGSVHAKLLNEQAPNLCQDCHDGRGTPARSTAPPGLGLPPGRHDPTAHTAPTRPGQPNAGVNTRLVARACLNCHNAIHGSNAPGNRGKFFTR